jgi:hypothetical protein
MICVRHQLCQAFQWRPLSWRVASAGSRLCGTFFRMRLQLQSEVAGWVKSATLSDIGQQCESQGEAFGFAVDESALRKSLRSIGGAMRYKICRL